MKKSNKPKIRTDRDGKFFCTGCGRADFRNIHQANGHTGACRGPIQVSEAIGAPSSPSPSSPLAHLFGNQDFTDALTKMSGGVAVVGDSNYSNILLGEIESLKEKIQDIQKATTNHIPHLNGSMNTYSDFFESNLFKLILAGLAVVAVLYIIEKGDSKTKQSVGNKILDLAIKKI